MASEDLLHNAFNYHHKFTKRQVEAKAALYRDYLKKFQILDWEGKKIRDGSTIPPNIDWPIPWNRIMRSLYKALLPYRANITILQIKEKFGGLRVYYEATTTAAFREVGAIITDHERKVSALYGKTMD